MVDQGSRSPGRRSSGAVTPHLADELEVYFNEYVRGSPVGFISTPKWRPATDIYETDEQFVVAMDIAGVAPDGFSVTFDAGVLSVSGERREQASGRREYHAMEVKVGPFERRFRFPKRVDPASLKATYDLGFLEIRLAKVAEQPQPVRVDVEAK
jgi:HSP20 family protein